MQDQYRVRERRYVDDPECPGIFPDPDFANARTYRFHRLPVVGIVAVLDLVELVAGIGSGIIREVSKPDETVP